MQARYSVFVGNEISRILLCGYAKDYLLDAAIYSSFMASYNKSRKVKHSSVVKTLTIYCAYHWITHIYGMFCSRAVGFREMFLVRLHIYHIYTVCFLWQVISSMTTG